MLLARPISRFAIAAFAVLATLHAQSSSPAPRASTAGSAVDLTAERALIAESRAARKASDYDLARSNASQAVASLLARLPVEQDATWLALLDSAADAAWDAQDVRTASTAWRRVLDIRSAALPDDHPELLVVRERLAGALCKLGDLAAARVLQEEVLEVRSRTLPDDDPLLQSTRSNLATTLRQLGDLAGARALAERALEVLARTRPADAPDLQLARANLAGIDWMLGDLASARALFEAVLEVRSRTLADDDPDLQATRANLAVTIKALGDLRGAKTLEEKVLEIRSRTLPEDHPDLQKARGNLAATLSMLGDHGAARALQERVLEVRSRTLPGDHPDLQTARANLAISMHALGDLARARALHEQVLDVRTRTLPDDHPELQAARGNFATILWALGDLTAARALQEKALEVSSRTLPDDHPDLQRARGNLAAALGAVGDLDAARVLGEKVLEVYSRTLPVDHPDVQTARSSLAHTMRALGDLEGAKVLQEEVLEIYWRTLPDDHPDLQHARLQLAATLGPLGDLPGAGALQEAVLRVRSATFADDHPALQEARENVAETIARQAARADGASKGKGDGESARERCADLVGAVCRARVRAARSVILARPGREAEERCASLAASLDRCLSYALGYGVFDPLPALEPECFAFGEITRGAALVSAELTRRAAGAPEYRALCDALREASDALAALARSGTTSEAFDRARARREAVEQELVTLARAASDGRPSGVELDLGALATRLDAGEAAVAYRRFARTRIDVEDELDSTGQPAVRSSSVASLCAFVVRGAGPGAQDPAPSVLTLVDLGPLEPIESAAREWRAAIGVGRERGTAVDDARSDLEISHGSELRRLVLDPLVAALGGADVIVVVLDDVLHLVPLDALPFDLTAPSDEGSRRCVGDRWKIETRATLAELSTDSPAPTGTALIALGGASFNVAPLSLSAEETAAIESGAPVDEAAALDVAQPIRIAAHSRGSAWERGFEPLTYTGYEARGIGALYREIHDGERPVLVLEKRKASREALVELAPRARFVHIATHGWFAPESIRSWSDPERLDKQLGLGSRLSGAEQVKGMSPMLLCGLALAGANLPEDAVGRAPGLVTADELSTLDLSNCELAVLSACDTNVGERRAGQGVASLQKALQMAGARSVITSLWKVPDEATKELMLDFYRRLWVEKKPKHQALWEAKTKLREAKDERGASKYTTRDWAAWVLTGEPR